MKTAILCFLLSFLLFQSTAKADHLPEESIASGKPEITLAGINLKSTTLKDVIRMYGSPTRQKKAFNNPHWTGYVWELPHAKLELGVSSGPSGTRIRNIYVEGTTDGQVGTTGRGLKLGDDINKLKRIYGNQFVLQKLANEHSKNRIEFTGVDVANQRATFQWREEDFTFTAGLDDKGIINAMWLILPECYPRGCE